jgi:hypothetical protein
VVDDARLAGRRDRAGEPHADRNPHAEADLPLQTARGGGHQLAARRVGKQDRRGVGVHQLADPRRQLDEQVVDVELGERRVGHRQEPA